MSAVTMPSDPPAFVSATPLVVENFPAGRGVTGSAPLELEKREAEKRGWRTCTEQREGDGEEEEEDDEADVPPQRRDPKNTQAIVSATARNERC